MTSTSATSTESVLLQRQADRSAVKASKSQEISWIKRQQCLPPGFKSVTVNNEGKAFHMAVLSARDIVSDSVAKTGQWEVAGIEQMAHRSGVHLPASGTFLDIGANLGYYSLLFAKQGYRVIAVEPGTNNRRAINASLCMNPDIAGLVQVLPLALTDASEIGNTRCVLRSTNTQINIGNMALTCGRAAEVKACGQREQACEEVLVKTLDSLLLDLKPSSVDAVKMDVEGHECNILRSGETLFSTYAPKLVQVETNVGHTLDCVKEAAAKAKYTLKAVSNADTVMAPES